MSTRLIVAIILGGALLAALAFGVGYFAAPSESTPSTTSAEAGFARDMQVHHNQAVRMSFIVRENTEDREIATLAYDIATAQQQQAGQMFGWLEVWGLPQAASEPSMTWMSRPTLDGAGHDHGEGDTAHAPGELMPGLATAEQMAELESLTGVEAEAYYLELMIAHHEGGVEMAQAVLDRSDNRVVRQLASGLVAVQEKEIALMEELLAERR
ncbi:DUF305 domain-containing protein [Salinibacterium sp. SYSU T00001]|uniref:DUF305 domain-containing protein n=1 Tax=Homoserinimonas sedimenticola TaxID=2986805 RepID=UPI0022361B41|nr:DUF305 domain-containing protein [Salinibacterium sedimenticola]MCW4385230.1 DUF305 domain-containing protein [Salinibacterium sedimenticola]